MDSEYMNIIHRADVKKKNILVGMIVINKPECHLSFGYKVFDNKWNRPCAVS